MVFGMALPELVVVLFFGLIPYIAGVVLFVLLIMALLKYIRS